MTSHKETIATSQEAKQAQPVLNRAFDRVREGLIQKLIATSPGEPQKVLELHVAIQGVDAARQAVIQEISAGSLAQANLDAEAALAGQKQD